MDIRNLLSLYQNDTHVQSLCQLIDSSKKTIQLKGLVGSMDSLVVAAVASLAHDRNHILIVHDKEEAAYIYTDLRSLLPHHEIQFFPTSYKKPYEFQDVDNANVLMRAEVLNRLGQHGVGEIIVTYPEALVEKVVNRKSLLSTTFLIKKKQTISLADLVEKLVTYDFDKTDFVYEAGQFAVRGGIIDIFSYTNDLPFRVELMGDEIDAIRTFDPITQLSVDHDLNQISILPNPQTKFIHEAREPLMAFFSDHDCIWVKDWKQMREVIDQCYDKWMTEYNSILDKTNQTSVVYHPDDVINSFSSLDKLLKHFQLIEFGKKNHISSDQVILFEADAQPSFYKDFQRLADNLSDNQLKGIQTIVMADMPKQIERLQSIFEEINSSIHFQGLLLSLREGFIDKRLQLACYTDHQIFERFHRYRIKESYAKSKALTLRELKLLQPGDYVTHVDYGIARFAGLEKIKSNDKVQEMIRLIYRDDDVLYVNIYSLHKIGKYSGKEGTPPSMSKLGSPEWENKKKKVKTKVKDIAKQLIELYAKRKAAPGYAFSSDTFLQIELESSFMYEDTPDQAKATQDVKLDMEKPHPMDRLVCGDVGFGKTEVAIRAAFKAVQDQKQVAVLVPTTILAMQHYRTFSERLAKFNVRIDYISRFKSTSDITETCKKIEKRELDILIGTHRIVGKDVHFFDLGLLIIDEEQKFGVTTKEKLKEMRVNVDTLTLTATPIPRTLHFSLMGARDLSIIATPPPNRQPVTTEVHDFNDLLIRDAISFELKRGGQVFFIHNRISDIEEVANIILRLVPDAKIAVAHGQMDGVVLEKTMMAFIDGQYDVLVSTNIVESGLDIPNANTIIINHAHLIGLSDLHQMRGRVGRSNRKAFCYLLAPSAGGLTHDARKRLTVLEEFSELGDGFKVAMRDLDIRGAGNLLGAEQSGFINDIGFEMYHSILNEAVQELKETDFKDLFQSAVETISKKAVKECIIETDLEVLVPDYYVTNISERLSLYTRLDHIQDEEALHVFQLELIDRFGPLPKEVEEMIQTVRLRWLGEKIGFAKIIAKNAHLKCYFSSPDKATDYSSACFERILQTIQQQPKRYKFNDASHQLILTITHVSSIQEAILLLQSFLSPFFK